MSIDTGTTRRCYTWSTGAGGPTIVDTSEDARAMKARTSRIEFGDFQLAPQ
ncbi:hypothetical protein [Pontibacter indicus]|uniref:hypothetical protein n=1 Tax=Pontibacter indicus TaxID=1317125 RepID=UPI0014819D50|nr:hypothetical protein [Pontibacter indicus]